MPAIRAADRLQQATWFKLAASAVIAATVITVLALDFLSDARDAVNTTDQQAQQQQPSDDASEPAQEGSEESARAEDNEGEVIAADPSRAALENLLKRRSDRTGYVSGVLAVGGLALGVVWLGLTITYLGFAALAGMIGGPLFLLDGLADLGAAVFGVFALAVSFTTLLQLFRLALDRSGPVTAIARNVLAEAVRMKLSVVFILLIVLLLAGLPAFLDDESQLRYRVQTFLQYGISIPFWILAVLTTLFGVATVAYEQRDKLIWQTVTKPVAPWKYILGKWIGVAGLNAIILTVCAAGVYLFTEYLRDQPASGEIAAYESNVGAISQDRLKLETEVLAARESVFSSVANLLERDSEAFASMVEGEVQTRRKEEPRFAQTEEQLAEFTDELYESYREDAYWINSPRMIYRDVVNASTEEFVGVEEFVQFDIREFEFRGLRNASGSPITVKYKISGGENNPSYFYQLQFIFNSQSRGPIEIMETVSPGTIRDIVVEQRGVPVTDLVDPDGYLRVAIINRGLVDAPNPNAALNAFVQIDPESFRVMYSQGPWQANLFRVVVVLWAKLAVLAMVGITLATFLSFPVACLTSGAIFLVAETAGSLGKILESYRTIDLRTREEIVWRVIVKNAADLIRQPFTQYAELRPSSRLVEGLRITWGEISVGLVALGIIWVVLFGLGVLGMSKRELAKYSGS